MMLQNDSQYWEAMKHRHLVLAYVLTWVVQLSYAGWVARRWVLAGRAGAPLGPGRTGGRAVGAGAKQGRR